MPIERFSGYDPFAWIYNQSWGGEFHSQVPAVLDQLLFPHLADGDLILDLCCGAGHVTQFLAHRQYRVIGIDGSEEMLHYARQKVPEGEFRSGDAREFTTDQPVAAVISTFDSLNHVMSLEELHSVFRHVYAALRPGGRFLFDLNRDEVYRSLWAATGTTVEDDKVCIARGAYAPEQREASCAITVFRPRDGAWERTDFTLRQRCHDTAEVIAALRDTGFSPVEAHDAQAVGMDGNIGYGRTFFFAARPS